MFPGIPPLLRNVASLSNKITLLVADARRILSLFTNAQPRWGLFKNGELILQCDSVIRLESHAEWSVPDYPQQNGAFQSYNKVRAPAEVNLAVTRGGNDSTRRAFLQALSALAGSLDIIDVYMPEGALYSYTLTVVGYKRSSTQGVGLLTAELRLVEIMLSADAAFSNTAAYSGITPTRAGTVQGVPPTDEQQVAAAITAGA